MKSLKKSIPRRQVVRIIDGDNELKYIAGRIPKATRSVGNSPKKTSLKPKSLSIVFKRLFFTSPALIKKNGKKFIPHNEITRKIYA